MFDPNTISTVMSKWNVPSMHAKYFQFPSEMRRPPNIFVPSSRAESALYDAVPAFLSKTYFAVPWTTYAIVPSV